MPKLDFEVITIGHGSGGVLTNKLLNESVFKLFNNEYLDQRLDGAILPPSGEIAFSTDSFVVSPLFFPGGNIGELAVNGTVNDLAMCGAIPKYLSLSFILEEGLHFKDFWNILVSIKEATEKANVKIVTGDTKVVEKGKGDQIFINTSGIGHIHTKARLGLDKIKIGDDIIISNDIASHGMSILSVREGLAFDSAILSDTASLNSLTNTLLDKFGVDIHLFSDPTRGGVATVLKEISQQGDFGIHLKQEEIPISDSVSNACELLGLDPLYVANEGVFIAFVSPKISSLVIQTLKNETLGQGARVVGQVTKDHHQVIMESPIGGKRAIGMLPGEQLPRIC